MAVIYINLCEVFDMVPLNTLDCKLERKGFDGRTIQWIKNWLEGYTQGAAVNDSICR